MSLYIPVRLLAGILDDVYCNGNQEPVKHCEVIVIEAIKPSTMLVIIYWEGIEYDIR